MNSHQTPIRRATTADVPRLHELDQACFSQSWGADAIEKELCRAFARIWVIEARQTTGSLEHASKACETDTHACLQIMGFAVFWMLSPQAELLRIGVDPEARRSGFAAQLIETGQRDAWTQGCHELLLEVAASNRGARALYTALGFEYYGLRAAYYVNPPDDAVLYRLRASKIG